jgi:hypothetical protein
MVLRRGKKSIKNIAKGNAIYGKVRYSMARLKESLR